MSVSYSPKYIKAGATFSSGAEAYADKNSLFSTDLTQAVNSCYDQMLANGVLLQPISYEWDQSTHTLTVVKIVSSVSAYRDAVTFNVQETIDLSHSVGWILDSVN